MASLLAIYGPLFGARFPIIDELTIGRAPGVTVQLIELQVSRLHAAIRLKDGQYLASDVSSRNGIFVNDARVVGEQALQPGDILRVGGSAFLFDATERFWRPRYGQRWVLAGGEAFEGLLETLPPDRVHAGALDERAVEQLASLATRGLEEEALLESLLTWLLAEVGATRGALWMSRVGYPLRLQVVSSDQQVLSVNQRLLQTCMEVPGATYLGTSSLSRFSKGQRRLQREIRAVVTTCWTFGERHHGFLWLEREGPRGAFPTSAAHRLSTFMRLVGPLLEEAHQRVMARRRVWLERTQTQLEHLPGLELLEHLGLLERARALATHLQPTAIIGPRGMGKERVARAIHLMSPRWDAPILHLQCARLSEKRARLELFGAASGQLPGWPEGFPGKLELAGGGGLVLGEVEALSPGVQQDLLRALSLGEILREGGDTAIPIHLRLYVTSSRLPSLWVEGGRLRSDLLPLLAAESLELPALDDVAATVPALARALLARLNLRLGRTVRNLSPGAETYLKERSWPQNLWDLEAHLLRAMTLCDQEFLTREDLELAELASAPKDDVFAAGTRFSDTLRATEQRLVVEALKLAKGSPTRAAELLGISRAELDRKLIELGIRG